MARKITLFVYALVIFLIPFLGICPALAQESSPKTINELKARLEAEMQKQHIAGMMLSIVTRDSVLFSGGLGYSDIGKKTPVTENHLFRGASITKLFVALGILNLVKEGKLTVDTKLKDIAPEVPYKNKWEATNPITIGELMEHTTGFSDKSPFEEYNFSEKKYFGIEAIGVFKDFMVAKWKPGERHSYSSVNYAVLDYIIQKVAGKPTPEYLREKVFTPLGMPQANVSLTDDGSQKYSKGYVWNGDHFQLVPHQPAFNSGYSSLNISALDFANALKAYLNNWQTPSGKFLSKDILEDSQTPHTYLSAEAGLENTYAHGNESNDVAGHIFRGHRGAIGGFLSAFLYNRSLGLGFAFAVNTHNENFYRYADGLISQFLLQHSEKPKAVSTYPINKAAIEPYLGYYRLANTSQLFTGFFESLNNTIKVAQAGDELDVRIINRGSMQWQAVDKTGLRYKGKYATNPHIVFLKDGEDKPVIADGTMYFEKTTAYGAWAPIVLFVFSSFIVVSIIVFGLINVFLFIIKKIPKNQLLVRLSPALSTIGLLMILWTITQLFEHMKEATPMSGLFFMWTLGKYIFALFAITGVILLYRHRTILKSKSLKIYLIFAAFANSYLLYVLVANNWFW